MFGRGVRGFGRTQCDARCLEILALANREIEALDTAVAFEQAAGDSQRQLVGIVDAILPENWFSLNSWVSDRSVSPESNTGSMD